jgi:hypothetical protein
MGAATRRKKRLENLWRRQAASRRSEGPACAKRRTNLCCRFVWSLGKCPATPAHQLDVHLAPSARLAEVLTRFSLWRLP